MKDIASWLSLILLIALTRYAAAQEPQADQPDTVLPALLAAKPLPEDPKDDELRKLLKARYNEAIGEVAGQYAMYQSGRSGAEVLYEAGQRLLQAGLELHERPADKIALLTQYVELTRQAEKLAQSRHEAALAPNTEVHRARYQRLDAEIQLLRAQRAAGKGNRR